MEYIQISAAHFEDLSKLHTAYKAAIQEVAPTDAQIGRLFEAIRQGAILFYGCIHEQALVACCSVCLTYSTFNYEKSGIFEDFYILPEYRHQGIAKELVRFAIAQSGVKSLIVDSADCDVDMYKAIGFSVPLGNMLAFNL